MNGENPTTSKLEATDFESYYVAEDIHNVYKDEPNKPMDTHIIPIQHVSRYSDIKSPMRGFIDSLISGSINVVDTPGLYLVSENMVREYKKLHLTGGIRSSTFVYMHLELDDNRIQQIFMLPFNRVDNHDRKMLIRNLVNCFRLWSNKHNKEEEYEMKMDILADMCKIVISHDTMLLPDRIRGAVMKLTPYDSSFMLTNVLPLLTHKTTNHNFFTVTSDQTRLVVSACSGCGRGCIGYVLVLDLLLEAGSKFICSSSCQPRRQN